MNCYRLSYLLQFTFGNWKYYHVSAKKLGRILKKVTIRYNTNNLFFAFGCIRTVSIHNDTFYSWKAFTKGQLFKNILSFHAKSNLSSSFTTWNKYSNHISTLSRKLNTILSSTNARLQLKYLNTWTHKISTQKAVEFTEIHGKSASINKSLQQLLQVYHKFVRKEGLTSQYIDKFLMEHLPLSQNLSRKSIKKSDSLEFSFTAWKCLLIKKKKLLSCAYRMQAYRRKGETLHAFSTWKRCYPLFSHKIKSMPRRILLDTLATMDRDINSLQIALKEKHLSLRYVESYTEILEDNVRKGQNQALANCAGNIKRGLLTAMNRWFVNAQTRKLYELYYRLREVEEELSYVRRKCKEMDVENKELVIENKGLIKNTYESRDLANSLKALTYQKERFEEEIKDKSDTIRRLVQENRHLAMELSSYS